MSKMVVIDGDELEFDLKFGLCMVTPKAQLRIHGNGDARIGDKKICVLGDEKYVSIAATYTKTSHPTLGKGNITITALAADQQAVFATAKTAVIVVGSQFTACFTPTSPARDQQGKPDMDLSPVSGAGIFINSQSFVMAG